MLRDWRCEEERIGIEIDLRVIAYVFGQHRSLDQALPFLPEANLEDPQWRYQAYASILWPRGNVVRNQKLSWWNPFAPTVLADRFLVLDCLEDAYETIDVTSLDWLQRTRHALAHSAQATITGPASNPLLMKRALLALIAEPVEVGVLYAYPKAETARRRGTRIQLDLVCKEATA
jgi:hypothetical protein